MDTTDTHKDSEEKQKQRQFLVQVIGLHEQLLDSLNYEEMSALDEDSGELREYLYRKTTDLLNAQKFDIPEEQKEKFIDAVINEIMGFGPIEPLLRDPNVTDIFVNSSDTIFYESRGKVSRSPITFLDDDHVFRLVQRIASKSGRHLNLATPYLNSQMPDGSRLHAIIPPIAMDGVKLSIRKFDFAKLEVENLIQSGSLTNQMAKFLQIAVRARFNMVICGGTGSGKTTLLNSLLDSIRAGERVVTLEDTPELEPEHGHVIRLVTRGANPEGRGAVTLEDLMINALRMRPDRVILGEMRGSEAFNLLHAMNTGQDGSMATIHASGPEEVLARLVNMILMAKYSLSVESIRQQIAGALDVIVYIARLVDGSRRVMYISQVSADEDGDIKIEPIFRYFIDKIDETAVEGNFLQFPMSLSTRCMNKLMTSGLLEEYNSILEMDEDI